MSTRCIPLLIQSPNDSDFLSLAQPSSPETLVELAYIQDPSVFNRDAATRRSAARAALRKSTGWSDEQVEGWKVMLERDVSTISPGDASLYM